MHHWSHLTWRRRKRKRRNPGRGKNDVHALLRLFARGEMPCFLLVHCVFIFIFVFICCTCFAWSDPVLSCLVESLLLVLWWRIDFPLDLSSVIGPEAQRKQQSRWDKASKVTQDGESYRMFLYLAVESAFGCFEFHIWCYLLFFPHWFDPLFGLFFLRHLYVLHWFIIYASLSVIAIC